MGSRVFRPQLQGFAPRGARTAEVTLERMRDLVNASVERSPVLEAARAIVRGIDGRDFAAQLGAIAWFLTSRTAFLRDPVDDEYLQSPELMLERIRHDGVAEGDCDDVAMLGAALAKAIGFRAGFVAESYQGPAAPFQHVYAVVASPAGPRSLDVQRPRELTHPALRRITLEV